MTDDADSPRPGPQLRRLPARLTFAGARLRVDAGVLFPRPETEFLVDVAIRALAPIARPAVIDMCCGVGNLGIAIARVIPEARVWASDIGSAAIRASRYNAIVNRVADRFRVLQGDLFAPLVGLGLEAAIDLVICNPPYIPSHRLDRDKAPLLACEPREAFDGGPYGLCILQRVIKDAVAFLKPKGVLALEVGEGQSKSVMRLMERDGRYDVIAAVAEPSGAERVVLARRQCSET